MSLVLEKDKGVSLNIKCVEEIYETECSANLSTWS